MAAIPPVRRLSTEDFPEQAKWIDKLLGPINAYMEQTTTALNRGLTIGDNFAGQVRTVELNGTFPVKLAWSLSSRPVAVLVGNTVLSSGAALTLTDAVQVQWSYNQSAQLQIDGVVGVTPTAAAKYKLTLVVLTG